MRSTARGSRCTPARSTTPRRSWLTAQAVPLDDAARARIDLVRAEISFATDRGDEALPLLLAAAPRGSSRSTPDSRGTPTWMRSPRRCSPAASPPGPVSREVADAVRKAAAARAHRARATRCWRGSPCCSPTATRRRRPLAHRAVQAFAARGADPRRGPALQLARRGHGGLAVGRRAAGTSSPAGTWRSSGRTGALSALPLALHTRVVVQLFSGDLARRGGTGRRDAVRHGGDGKHRWRPTARSASPRCGVGGAGRAVDPAPASRTSSPGGKASG